MRHPARWRAAIGALVLAAALAFIVTPGKADSDADEGVVAAPNRVSIRNGVVTLTLTAADQRDDGIVTAPTAPAPAQRGIAAYGEVLDAAALTQLGNRILDAAVAVRIAEAKLAVSRAAFDRAKLLHRDQQNVSAAQLQAAEGSFAVDQADLAAARARRDMTAASARQGWGNTIGAALIDRTRLIADLTERRDYLVKVTLPSGESVTPAPATALTRINGGPKIRLTFVSAATAADPTVQGVSYFYEAPAASLLLPGLRLAVSLAVEAAAHGAIVPDAAVVWLDGGAWIYVCTGANTFERRQLHPARAAADGGYIVPDLPAGTRIVVRGAQMLLSEEFRAQAPIED